jgi:hypothetical protein
MNCGYKTNKDSLKEYLTFDDFFQVEILGNPLNNNEGVSNKVILDEKIQKQINDILKANPEKVFNLNESQGKITGLVEYLKEIGVKYTVPSPLNIKEVTKPSTSVKKGTLSIQDVLKEYTLEELKQGVNLRSLQDKVLKGDEETIKTAYNYLKASEKVKLLKKDYDDTVEGNKEITRKINSLTKRINRTIPTKVGDILNVYNDENDSDYKVKVLEITKNKDYAILKVITAKKKEYTIRVESDGSTKNGDIDNFVFESSKEDIGKLRAEKEALKSQLVSSEDYFDYDNEFKQIWKDYFKPTQTSTSVKGFKLSIDKKGKDQGKADLANRFIGYGVKGTSTYQYEQDAKKAKIPVNYEGTIDDNTIAFVSVNGNGKASENAIYETIENAREVFENGGTVIMDSTYDANRSWNISGEALVQEQLGKPYGQTSRGYNYWGKNPELKENDEVVDEKKEEIKPLTKEQELTKAKNLKAFETVINKGRQVKLDSEGKYYVNVSNPNEKYDRQSNYIKEVFGEEDVNENEDIKAAQIRGNFIDILSRDIFDGKESNLEAYLKEINESTTTGLKLVVSKEVFSEMKSQISKVKEDLQSKGFKFHAKDIAVFHKYKQPLGDTVGMAGVLDLVVEDRFGEFHIVDFKTKTHTIKNMGNTNDAIFRVQNFGDTVSKPLVDKWAKQQTAYDVMIDVPIASINILPILVNQTVKDGVVTVNYTMTGDSGISIPEEFKSDMSDDIINLKLNNTVIDSINRDLDVKKGKDEIKNDASEVDNKTPAELLKDLIHSTVDVNEIMKGLTDLANGKDGVITPSAYSLSNLLPISKRLELATIYKDNNNSDNKIPSLMKFREVIKANAGLIRYINSNKDKLISEQLSLSTSRKAERLELAKNRNERGGSTQLSDMVNGLLEIQKISSLRGVDYNKLSMFLLNHPQAVQYYNDLKVNCKQSDTFRLWIAKICNENTMQTSELMGPGYNLINNLTESDINEFVESCKL